jgi:hypothetical protein
VGENASVTEQLEYAARLAVQELAVIAKSGALAPVTRVDKVTAVGLSLEIEMLAAELAVPTFCVPK